MKLIVAVTQDWGIGAENKLLAPIPEDMKRFRAMTLGKVVVMGRKTLDSLPGGKPLKNRTNIVLSRNADLSVPGVQVFQTVDGLLEGLERYDPNEVFVIGGQLVYERLLPHCTAAYVTRITTPQPLAADRFFPNLDELPRWRLAEEGPVQAHGDLTFRYCRYERVAGTGQDC